MSKHKPVRQPTINADYRYLVESHGINRPQGIIIHTTESHDEQGLGDLRSIAEFFKRQGKGYGYHILIDKDGNSAQLVDFGEVAWGCGGANHGYIQISLIGFARTPLRVWWLRPKQLRRTAQWVAYLSKRFDIPIVHSTGHGISRHLDQSKVHSSSAGHWDPGWSFPFKFILKLSRNFKKWGWDK